MSRLRTFSGLGTLCGLSVLFAVALAWKLDWLPVSLSAPETGTLAELPPESAEPAFQLHVTDFEPEFPRQKEPGVADVPAGTEPVEISSHRDVLQELRAALAEVPHASDSNASRPIAEMPHERNPAVTPWEWQSAADGRVQANDAIVAGDRFQAAPASAGIPADGIVQVAYQDAAADDDAAADSAPQRVAIVESKNAVPPAGAAAATQPAATRLPAGGIDLAAIDALIAGGQEIVAHRDLSRAYWDHVELRPAIQERLEKLAERIYWSPQPHYMPAYEVQPGDQLRLIAQRYHVPWEYLARLNRVDPRRIRAGQKLKVIKGPFSAFVDLSDFELTIHAHGYYVRKFPVGIGRDGSSPIGTFTVINKVTNPQYTDPDGRVIAGDDPQNPLGEHWIDIGDSFGIHGTIDPNSIGKAESRGCVRLRNEDVSVVYDLLEVGSEVVIRP